MGEGRQGSWEQEQDQRGRCLFGISDGELTRAGGDGVYILEGVVPSQVASLVPSQVPSQGPESSKVDHLHDACDRSIDRPVRNSVAEPLRAVPGRRLEKHVS